MDHPGAYAQNSDWHHRPHDQRPYQRKWEPRPNQQQNRPVSRFHKLVGKNVTIKWIDANTVWNWYRILGFEHGLINLVPVGQDGELQADGREPFWTPVQSVDLLVERIVMDGDLAEWLKQ